LTCSGYRLLGPPCKKPVSNGSSKEDHQGSFHVFRLEKKNNHLGKKKLVTQESPLVSTAHLTTPIEDQAMCYFMRNFVLMPGKSSSRGHLAFIPGEMRTEDRDFGHSAIRTVVKAAALSFLASRVNSSSMRQGAAEAYSVALKYVNSAIRNPTLALEDQTLAAVALLSIFEVYTISEPKWL
jgi:hypothetical protein